MRRRLPFFKLVVLLTVALALTAAASLWLVRIDRVVTAPGALTGGSLSVTSPHTARVAEVLVRAGDSVDAGRPLVRLETDALKAERERATSRTAALEQRIRAQTDDAARLRREVHPREREQAARLVERARLELSQATVKAQAMAKLGADGLAGRLDVEAAEFARQLAEMDLEEAERGVPLLRAEQESDLERIVSTVAAMESERAAERTALGEIERLLAISIVRAPRDGVVLAVGLDDLPGRQVGAGDALLRIAVAPAERFEGLLADSGRSLASAGQQVKIRIDGYPWLIHGVLAGRVEHVADRREPGGGFPVRVVFDPGTAPGVLYEGMRGKARIIIEERVSLGRLLVERVTRPAAS